MRDILDRLALSALMGLVAYVVLAVFNMAPQEVMPFFLKVTCNVVILGGLFVCLVTLWKS
jgi:hypothetical protein